MAPLGRTGRKAPSAGSTVGSFPRSSASVSAYKCLKHKRAHLVVFVLLLPLSWTVVGSMVYPVSKTDS